VCRCSCVGFPSPAAFFFDKGERDRWVSIQSSQLLTLSARHPFQNFSTPCILNVNNTAAKQRSIMK
jgi:hypothetical protein